MIRRINLVALSLILMQSLLFAAQPMREKNPGSAPDFKLLDLDNKEFSLSDFRGKPVILFFWATWCPSCRKELNALGAMHADLKRDGVQVLAIDVDEPADKVRKFIGKSDFPYRILLDTGPKVAYTYGLVGVPTYIFIDKQGRIVFSDHYFPEKEYQDLISR